MDPMPFALETRLKEHGADFVDGGDWQKNVQVSGRVITGQNPASATGLGEAIAKKLKELWLNDQSATLKNTNWPIKTRTDGLHLTYWQLILFLRQPFHIVNKTGEMFIIQMSYTRRMFFTISYSYSQTCL